MVNAAHDERELRVPPSNHFEELQGRRRGEYSIRINNRVVFRWHGGNAYDVQIEDYPLEEDQ
jgi:toxin HigB-1